MCGEAVTVEIVRKANLIALPFVVLGELRAGFRYGSKLVQNEAKLTAFLNSPRVLALFPDDQTTDIYGQLYADLRKRGVMIPMADIWIAALVVQHRLTLCSRDSHFDHLPQLMRI